MIHSADKPYVCPTCSKPFGHKHSLKTHMLFHSQVKPHECPTCQKRFALKAGLDAHLITHSDLSVHANVRTHNCNSCQKRFYYKSDLVKHARIHSGVKPYACDICKKGFAQKINLIRHLRVHSGEKPFICSTYKKSFAQQGHVKKHQIIHLNIHQPKYSLRTKTSSLKSKDILLNYELLKRHGCLRNVKIVCHKLTDDVIQLYSSKASEENVKKEVDSDLKPNKADFCFEVPIIKQELMTGEDLETPSCSYQTLKVKQEPTENADPTSLNICDDNFIKEETELPTTI